MEAACGFCIGAGQAPCSDGVSLRTSNRNFEGRSGTASAQIYLVSPETAALSAVHGSLVNPLDFPEAQHPRVVEPESFLIDDSMILAPSRTKIPVLRGPNIGEPPVTSPLADRIDGIVGIKVGDKITTDHIMPAGRRLLYRSNIPVYARYVFEDMDADFARRALDNKKRGIYTAIVAGQSYGQGSSREHAAICPQYLGVRAVLAKSIERIHAANLINFGILPLLFLRTEDYDTLQAGAAFTADNLIEAVKNRETFNISFNGRPVEVSLRITRRQRDILLDGGLLHYTRRRT